MKKSPDPWLGLAPLYINSLHDLAHGEAAIRQANHLGYATGKRETAELADGYLYRAERAIALGDQASTKSQATHYYRMAAPDLARARRLYESILPWDGAAANLKQVNDSIRPHLNSQVGQRRGTNGGNSQHIGRPDPEPSPAHADTRQGAGTRSFAG